MILYLLFFLICFLIENLKKSKSLSYLFFLFSLYAFLCFGYMTGSDWRGYEMGYDTQDFLRMETTGEVGFIFVTKFVSGFVHDFWLYNGIVKCLYLASLIKFFRCFTSKPYISVALGFANSLLFMLIDCPMRFMMAMTLLLFSITLIISERSIRNIVICIILLSISVTLHTSMIVMVILVILAYFAPLFSKLNPIIISLFFMGTLILAGFSNIFNFIFNNIIPMVGDDRFDNYTRKEQSTLMTINTIKYIILFFILLANRDSIVKSHKYGIYIYFYASLYFVFFPITYSIPTWFRLNIFYGYFADISFVCVISNWNKKSLKRKLECGIIISMTLFMLCRNCYMDYKLTPYSNSIPYIISGKHLPFSYRDSYNPNHHDAEFWF